MEISKLRGVVTIDGLSQADRGLRNLESRFQSTARQAESAGGKIAGSMRSAGSALSGALNIAGGNLLSSALGGIASKMTDGIKAGIEYNKMLENSALSFEVLFKSADKAQSHLKELEKFALDNPAFDFASTIDASKRLQAFGFEAEKVIPALRNIGDAAAFSAGKGHGFAETLDGITLAMGQMRAKGKVSAEEMNQLAERGIPAWEILSQKIGKSVKETMKMGEPGKLKGAPAVDAILEGFNERFGGLSAKQANTIAGAEAQAMDALAKRAGESTKETAQAYRRSLLEIMAGAGSETASNFSKEFDTRLAADISVLTDLFGGKISAKELGAALVPTVRDTFTELGGYAKTGFGAGLDGLKGVVEGLFQGGVEGAKEAWQTRSPSRVAMEIGENVAEGFALGLLNGESDVQDAMSRVFGGLSAGIQPGQGRWRTAEENKQRAAALADDPRIKAFLDTISKAEGADYNTMFGGGKFGSYGDHPRQRITRKLGGKPLTSTAAGRYQFLSRTWDSVSGFLGLDDFSPRSQDIAATELLRRRGVIPNILSGDIGGALTGANREWASLPGSPYGQPTKKASSLVDFYNSRLTGMGGAPVAEIAAPLKQIAPAVPRLADALVKIAASPLASFTPAASALPLNLGILGAVGMVQDPVNVVSEIVGKLDPVPLNEFRGSVELNTDRITRMRAELEALAPSLGTVTASTRNWAREILGGDFDLKASIEDLAGNLGNDINSTLSAALTGGDWREGLRGLFANFATGFLNTIQSELISKLSGGAHSSIGSWAGSLVSSALSGLIGGFGGGVKLPVGKLNTSNFGAIPFSARADGGPVAAGRRYLVGEEGPELFMPRTSGMIIPNHAMAGAGGGIVLSPTYIIQAPSVAVARASAAQIESRNAALLQRAIQRNQ